MIKILLITDNHSPHGGGAEKYFFILKNALLQQNDVSVYSLGFGTEKKQEKNAVILKETSSRILRQWWRMFLHPLKYWEIRRAIQKINPDIIHLHNIKKYTISLLKAVQGYPVIQTVHDFSPICPTGWNVHQDMQPCREGMQLACAWQHKRHYNGIAYLGMLFSFFRMKQLLKKTVRNFITPSPVLEHYLRINHFQATTYLPPFRKELSTFSFDSIKANHFLFVGQLEEQKGIRILVREFAIAHQKNNKLILKIAGTGSQQNWLQETIKSLNLENNILLPGWVNPQDLYDECVAVIFSSIGLESFGLVITEAMSHARPVIGSNRGPTSWLIDDKKTGLLFEPFKQGDLAGKILQLADDTPLAQTLGKNSFDKLQNDFLNNESIIHSMVTLYEQAITRIKDSNIDPRL